MKVIIAGSRTVTDPDLVERAVVNSGFHVTEVVSGGARGVDLLGERWVRECRVPIKRFNAEWDKYGKSAGYIRNRQMAQYVHENDPNGGALIAIWNGYSPGTKGMIKDARELGMQVYVEEVLAS